MYQNKQNKFMVTKAGFGLGSADTSAAAGGAECLGLGPGPGGAWGRVGNPPEGTGSHGRSRSPPPGAQSQQLCPPHSAEALTLGLGLRAGVKPPIIPVGGGPRGSLGQAADWAAETSSDGGEIKETEEITGLGLTSVSTHTTDTMDNQSLPRSSGTCGPCSLGT